MVIDSAVNMHGGSKDSSELSRYTCLAEIPSQFSDPIIEVDVEYERSLRREDER